jgi:hypothetical protein
LKGLYKGKVGLKRYTGFFIDYDSDVFDRVKPREKYSYGVFDHPTFRIKERMILGILHELKEQRRK